MSDQRRERDRTAHPAVEAGPGPHTTPCVSGDELLEVACQIGNAGRGTVDVVVTEHLATNLHALGVVTVGHDEASSKKVRSAVAVAVGDSAGGRWPHPASTVHDAPGTASAVV